MSKQNEGLGTKMYRTASTDFGPRFLILLALVWQFLFFATVGGVAGVYIGFVIGIAGLIYCGVRYERVKKEQEQAEESDSE